jgi:hypothetical protein
MKLKLKLLFLVCIGMFNVQAQTAKKSTTEDQCLS